MSWNHTTVELSGVDQHAKRRTSFVAIRCLTFAIVTIGLTQQDKTRPVSIPQVKVVVFNQSLPRMYGRRTGSTRVLNLIELWRSAGFSRVDERVQDIPVKRMIKWARDF